MTMREKIATGGLYTDHCEGLEEERLRGKELAFDFNMTRPSEVEKRLALTKEMFGSIGEGAWIEPPIHFAYGSNIHIGKNVYINFNFTVVDDYKVTIGDNVLIAPNVVISVTGHPLHPEVRKTGLLYSLPVTIEDNVWLGTGVIINPGVTIGHGSVIGAGSVVTKDIPANVVAVGNPCRVLREINEHDREFYYKDRRVDEK